MYDTAQTSKFEPSYENLSRIPHQGVPEEVFEQLVQQELDLYRNGQTPKNQVVTRIKDWIATYRKQHGQHAPLQETPIKSINVSPKLLPAPVAPPSQDIRPVALLNQYGHRGMSRSDALELANQQLNLYKAGRQTYEDAVANYKAKLQHIIPPVRHYSPPQPVVHIAAAVQPAEKEESITSPPITPEPPSDTINPPESEEAIKDRLLKRAMRTWDENPDLSTDEILEEIGFMSRLGLAQKRKAREERVKTSKIPNIFRGLAKVGIRRNLVEAGSIFDGALRQAAADLQAGKYASREEAIRAVLAPYFSAPAPEQESERDL